MSGRTDTERLEWLQTVGDFDVTCHANEYYFLHLRSFDPQAVFSGDTLAEVVDMAIDAQAAMDAEERG